MIEYKNSNDKTVTAQQFNMLKDGEIHDYDDVTGELRKVENIIYMEKMGITRKVYEYYLDPSENKNNIIQQYTDVAKNYSASIYLNKQIAFGFEIWDNEDYDKNGVLKFKSKIVYDNQKRIILQVYFDLQTNQIIQHTAYRPTKYYFGTSLDTANGLPNLELKFTYEFDPNTNQFVTYVKDVNETSGEIHTMNVIEFIELFGQAFWDAHPYYHSLLPLLPTTTNV